MIESIKDTVTKHLYNQVDESFFELCERVTQEVGFVNFEEEMNKRYPQYKDAVKDLLMLYKMNLKFVEDK